jgi:hypothetical protein
MFWRILLFLHFLMAVALLAAVTLQAATVLIPARQSAGNFIDRFHPVAPANLVPIVVWLYVPNFLLGAQSPLLGAQSPRQQSGIKLMELAACY